LGTAMSFFPSSLNRSIGVLSCGGAFSFIICAFCPAADAAQQV
jgi:hypothetical protein